jgi:hypothetical protein
MPRRAASCTCLLTMVFLLKCRRPRVKGAFVVPIVFYSLLVE